MTTQELIEKQSYKIIKIIMNPGFSETELIQALTEISLSAKKEVVENLPKEKEALDGESSHDCAFRLGFNTCIANILQSLSK